MAENAEVRFGANDVIGAIKQMQFELNNYLCLRVPEIDPAVIIAYTERMADFARLLMNAQPAAQNAGEAAEQRAN